MLFDISSVDYDKKPTVYNHDKMNDFKNKLAFATNIVTTLEEFKKCDCELQQEILIELLRGNRDEIKAEIVRLLKIQPQFITTDYFKDLAKLLDGYNTLLALA